MADTMDCPKCSKKALVERHHDLYQCLFCDFKRDFTQVEPQANAQFPWIVIVIAIFLFLVVGEITYRPVQPRPSYGTPGIQGGQ